MLVNCVWIAIIDMCFVVKLLVTGMGYRRGAWYERSGIAEDAIVAIKGLRIEKKIEGTDDWVGHVYDDSCIKVW